MTKSLFSRLFGLKPDKKELLAKQIKIVTGLAPENIDLYIIALSHSSVVNDKSGKFRSNERLEYLGDAILGAIIAEYLFKTYPFKDEGFLTEIRSRIVNRESMSALAKKIGLDKLVQYNKKGKKEDSYKFLHGNALEALIGAVYLDKGHKKCRKFVIETLLSPHYDLDSLIENNTNYKSILIEWCQKNGQTIRFEIIKEEDKKHHKEFVSQVYINDELKGTGHGKSKKKADQNAAMKAYELTGAPTGITGLQRL